MAVAAAPLACKQVAAAGEKRPVPVRVETVRRSAAAGLTRYSGSLEPSARVDLAFRVGGYVETIAAVQGKRLVDKGDLVQKGELLARVRTSDYAQKVALARADVGQARAQATLADQQLERARRLFADDAITKAELDTRIAQADAARAQVQATLARAGEAEIALADTVLRAPMTGTVLARQIEIGALVAPGQPAFVIADTRTVKAVFGAPQTLVERIAPGSPVQVFVGAESEAKTPDKLLAARITRIAPAADSNGRVFSVEAALANPDRALRPGAVISVRVPDPPPHDQPVIVPLSAVVRAPGDPHGFAVFVLDGREARARARLQTVQLGEVVGNAVTVTDGLLPDQRVVTVGATLVRDGGDALVMR
jgi:RND family efflux transporter MFP subunit